MERRGTARERRSSKFARMSSFVSSGTFGKSARDRMSSGFRRCSSNRRL
jgi:hypothetical protein